MNPGNEMHDGADDPVRDRLLELLADRALFGLDAVEEGELERLLDGHPEADPAGLERMAAAVATALMRSDAPAELPAGLRERLLADARRFRAPAESARPGVRGRVTAVAVALLATAAGLMLLVGRRPDAPEPQPAPRAAGAAAVAERVAPTPALQREELLGTVADVVQLDCAAADATDDEGRASGDVVWSPSRQRGFLRIRGLSRNDPARSQYQVWIVDGARGTPVPGGVFDVAGDGSGDVVVPILPRGFVQGPTMFAVTVEPPGGAAGEFDRERVVARAK